MNIKSVKNEHLLAVNKFVNLICMQHFNTIEDFMSYEQNLMHRNIILLHTANMINQESKK